MRIQFLRTCAVGVLVGACSDAGASVGIGGTIDNHALATITISLAGAGITVGQSTQATATFQDASRVPVFVPTDSVRWMSSSTAIATVSLSGVVTGVATGPAVITASAMTKSGSLGLTVAPANATPVFQDNFDTGVRATSQGGYAWTSSTATVSVSSVRAFSGSNSLEFVFGPNALTAGADADAEQRFQFGAYLPEVWLEYMLYIPSNYFHRAVLGVNDTFNNKFIAFWRDDYASATDFRPRIELYPFGANGIFPSTTPTVVPALGSSQIRVVSTTSTTTGANSIDVLQPQVTPLPPAPNLISPVGPIKIGAWTQVRIHVKAASARFANDGVLELWADGVIVYRKTNGDLIGPSGNRELHNGYFLGYANSGFTDRTVLNIDDVKMYAANPGWTP
ncbi:hypothetical protein BH09GEM1_BH09GEM1_01810 [soil metagenome]